LDRASTYVAGNRHKDRCHWFVNNKEIDMITSNTTNQLSPEESRCDSVSQIMSSDRKKLMALEYLNNDLDSVKMQQESFATDSVITL
jgi:hypothetical protein